MGADLGSEEHGFPLLTGAGRLVIKDTAILAGAIVVLSDSAKRVLNQLENKTMKKYDAIIIGFGKGGKTLAAGLAERNFTVAMIERSDKMYGGTCINIGCIPTKTLVHQAKIASGMKNSTFEERREFYRNAIAVKESVTSALRDKNYHNLADHPNVTVYTGVGSFVSADVVSVRTSTEEIWLTSKQIIINTGAETIIPPIEGIADNSLVYTSTSIMELTDLPRRLVIVGGGYIGLEFASM